jgi:hypothetical protein
VIKTGQTRRRIIGQGLALLGLSSVPTAARAAIAQTGAESSRQLAARMASVLGPQESAAMVGAAYLRQVPAGRRSVARLQHEICQPRCAVADLRGVATGDLHDRLRAWVAEDFRNRSIVQVDGWLLSRTEASLAGMAALLAAGA